MVDIVVVSICMLVVLSAITINSTIVSFVFYVYYHKLHYY